MEDQPQEIHVIDNHDDDGNGEPPQPPPAVVAVPAAPPMNLIAVQEEGTTGQNINAVADETANNIYSATSPQLAVIPLHPACKKQQKLEAKQLPIVLGRTNLASWWWKSCPCQHYCRLHCRPVAQNIRSLSKVMIQLDTQGQIHLCGKNPHLVTIIPERNDQHLQVNDIISIGRRDREPWIRLQVVEKPPPSRKHQSSQQRKHRTSYNSTRLPPGIAASNKNDFNTRSSNNNGGNLNNNAASTHSNQQRQQPLAAANNPPEWITTTRKRKSPNRRGGGRSSNHNGGSSSKPPTGNNKNNNNNGDSADSQPQRKRSRRNDKRQRSHGNKAAAAAAGQNPTANRNACLVEKSDHHPQVHLVFQDYETSANLLQGLHRTRRKRSSRSGGSGNKSTGGGNENSSFSSKSGVAAATAAAATAHLHTTQYRRHRSKSSNENKDNNEKKKSGGPSQLQLLSKNFAAAWQGSPMAAAGATPEQEEQGADYRKQSSTPSTESAAAAAAAPLKETMSIGKSDSVANDDSMNQLPETQPPRGLTWNNNNETNETILPQPKGGVAFSGPPIDILEGRNVAAGDGTSHQLSFVGLQQQHQVVVDRASNPQQPDADATADSGSSEDERTAVAPAGATAAAPVGAAADHSAGTMNLDRWREVIKTEEAKGNESSFRHALASFVVAKNEKSAIGGNDGNNPVGGDGNNVIWLPPLLENIDGKARHSASSPSSTKDNRDESFKK